MAVDCGLAGWLKHWAKAERAMSENNDDVTQLPGESEQQKAERERLEFYNRMLASLAPPPPMTVSIPISVRVGVPTVSFTAQLVWEDSPEPAPAPLPRRKSTEPIRAYRTWRLERTNGVFRIRSAVVPISWDGPILRAAGVPDDRMAPVPWQTGWSSFVPNNWGIFAYHRGEGPNRCLADRYLMRERIKQEGEYQCLVEGEAELLGKVIVHERGYRAEAARIASLVVVDAPMEWQQEGLVAKLEDRYQCPVSIENPINPWRIVYADR